jgi:hypothetical protein
MKLMPLLARATLVATLACAASLSGAQTAASPAKKELVQKVLQLQQGGLEALGSTIASQTANQLMQVVGQALQRVPADKREALANESQAEVRKFFDEVAPVLRDRAVKLGPTVIGPALEEKFTEDELKTLIAWLESSANKKFQQISGELQQTLGQKVVADTRPVVEPKLKALEQSLTKKLGLPAPGAAAASAPAPKASGAKK